MRIILQFFQNMPALEALDLAYCLGFGDAGMGALITCKKLKTLVLLSCRALTDDGLSAISLLDELEDVYLDGCSGVTEEGMNAVGDLSRPSLNLIRFSVL